MNKKIFSQEGLKILACVTMLLDHIGAVFMPSVANYSLYYVLRIIGRLAFPFTASCWQRAWLIRKILCVMAFGF